MRVPLVASASLVLVFVLGCGQDVPTCESDCAALTPDTYDTLQRSAPSSSLCETTCTTDQASATANGNGASFQLLLTCIGNAGGFGPECAPLACGLTEAFGTPAECTSNAGGSSHGDASVDTAAACEAVGGTCVVPSNVECTSVSGSPPCGAGRVCCGP